MSALAYKIRNRLPMKNVDRARCELQKLSLKQLAKYNLYPMGRVEQYVTGAKNEITVTIHFVQRCENQAPGNKSLMVFRKANQSQVTQCGDSIRL